MVFGFTLTLHVWCGIIAVFSFAGAVFGFALIVVVVYGLAVAVFSFALIVVVFGFAVAVFSFALIVAVFSFAVVIFNFSLSLQAWCGIVAVFGFTVAVFGFALISSKRFLQIVVVAPDDGGREICLWREIIFDYDLMHCDTSGLVYSSSPYYPHGAPIFPGVC